MLMYHGTNKSNYESIMIEGVRKYSYWTPYLSAAIEMGGCYVVAAFFNGIDEYWIGEDNWEYVSEEAVLPARLIATLKYDVQLLTYNADANREMRKYYARMDENLAKMKESLWCDFCDGQGELTYKDNGHWFLPGGAKFNSPDSRRDGKIVACPKCRGYG